MSYEKYTPREEVNESIEVWICEDHAELRQTTAEIISEASGMHCTVAVGSMEKILREFEKDPKCQPDVLLLDIGLPGISGLEGIQSVKSRAPKCKIIIYTVLGDERNTFEALKNGVDGYLLKGEDIDLIPECIKDVFEGGAPVSSSINRLILDRFQKEEFQMSTQTDPYNLSENEKSVLLLCSHGMIKKDIEEALGITYHRVDYYIRTMFKKMNVTTIHGAVGKALREGIITEAISTSSPSPDSNSNSNSEEEVRCSAPQIKNGA